MIKRSLTLAASLRIGGAMPGEAAEPEAIAVLLLDDDVSFRVPVRMFGRINYFPVKIHFTAADVLPGGVKVSISSPSIPT